MYIQEVPQQNYLTSLKSHFLDFTFSHLSGNHRKWNRILIVHSLSSSTMWSHSQHYNKIHKKINWQREVSLDSLLAPLFGPVVRQHTKELVQDRARPLPVFLMRKWKGTGHSPTPAPNDSKPSHEAPLPEDHIFPGDYPKAPWFSGVRSPTMTALCNSAKGTP